MIISIQQPEHWPWLGYFDKIRQVDEVVFFDNVQFKPRYFECRQQIRNYKGTQWIRIPVKDSGHRQLITDVRIDNTQDWRKTAWESIRLNYIKAPYWNLYEADVRDIYSREWDKLADFNITGIKWLAKKFELKPKYVLSSELNVEGVADDLLVNICKKLKATDYLSGSFGKDYIDPGKFIKAGVKLHFQEFVHPEYYQFQGKFEPYMSTLDLLFNIGPDAKKVFS